MKKLVVFDVNEFQSTEKFNGDEFFYKYIKKEMEFYFDIFYVVHFHLFFGEFIVFWSCKVI